MSQVSDQSEAQALIDVLDATDEAVAERPTVIIVGGGHGLPHGLVDALIRNGHRIGVACGERLTRSDPMISLEQIGFIDGNWPSVKGKGRKSRFNRENRWR